MFVDRVRIWAIGGDGGKGCCSFRREKFIPKGGPDGGDGGKRGDIVLKVNPHMNNLAHLRYKPHHMGGKGRNGGSAHKKGAMGKPCVIEVPPGTVVSQLPTTEETFERGVDFELAEFVVDLVEPEREFLLCKGGDGGFGNMHYRSSLNQTPRRADPGHPGERGQYLLELKSIADVGLVGFPNAGKSSLLGAVSHAKPKVAPYPFTTLSPVIGVIENERFERVTMADIPGIVEGAHEGTGLGLDFLRHIERCRLLLFVLDMAGTDGRDPVEDYRQLRKEISLYDEHLSDRPYFVVANKMDQAVAEENLKRLKRKVKVPLLPISTMDGRGLEALREEIHRTCGTVL